MRATEKEVLKQVVQYENYKISDCGKVLSVGRYFKNQFGQSTKKSKDKFLKQYKTTTGYLQVDLCQDSKYKKVGVHRLVAIAFIPNPENKKEVNHKDGNKENNHVSNLEWATSSENKRHAWDNGLVKVTPKWVESCRQNGLKNKGRKRK